MKTKDKQENLEAFMWAIRYGVGEHTKYMEETLDKDTEGLPMYPTSFSFDLLIKYIVELNHKGIDGFIKDNESFVYYCHVLEHYKDRKKEQKQGSDPIAKV